MTKVRYLGSSTATAIHAWEWASTIVPANTYQATWRTGSREVLIYLSMAGEWSQTPVQVLELPVATKNAAQAAVTAEAAE